MNKLLTISSISDLSIREKQAIGAAQPYTMTSLERMATLISSVKHVVQNGISGDIVECGVWRGGSMMLAAYTLLACHDQSRSIWLYDTFEGMSSPTVHDKCGDDTPAEEWLKGFAPKTGGWCYANIDDVRANMLSTGYLKEKIHLIKGKVEDTLLNIIPKSISLLRLDTDWYESTQCELEHLYPVLSSGGILILDDYGHWKGARKAADEFLQEHEIKSYLHRIDYSGRLMIKP